MEKEKNGKENTAVPAAVMRRSKTWCSERVLAVFAPVLTDELSKQAADLLRRRRVVDFVVHSGRVTAKVFDDLSRPMRVELLVRQISADKWEKIFADLAEQAFYFAMLLSGQLPRQMEEVFADHKCELFPSAIERFTIVVKNQRNAAMSKEVAAVLYRLCDKLDEDPLAIFALRGRGLEETLLEIRKRRATNRGKLDQTSFLHSPAAPHEPALPLVATIDHFWSWRTGLAEVSYNIKADELPAFILKWLDPLPLGGLEDKIDFILEQAYAKVARLAQGFGLGL